MYTFKITATLSNDEGLMAAQTTEWFKLDKAGRNFLEKSMMEWLASLPEQAAKHDGT